MGSTPGHPPRMRPAPAGDERAVPLLRLDPQQKMRCSRCQRRRLSPSIQIQLWGEPSDRGNLMAGEAGPGRREPAAARRSSLQGTATPGETAARLRPCRFISEERQRQSFTAVLGVFRGMNLLGIGQRWFAWLWLSGRRCLCREIFRGRDIYVCMCVYTCASSCKGCCPSEAAGSLPGWAACFRGGQSAEGAWPWGSVGAEPRGPALGEECPASCSG